MQGLLIRSLSHVSAASAGFTPKALAAGTFLHASRRKTATCLRTVAALLAVVGLAGISVANAQTAHVSGYRTTTRTVSSNPTSAKAEISLKGAPLTGDFGAVVLGASSAESSQQSLKQAVFTFDAASTLGGSVAGVQSGGNHAFSDFSLAVAPDQRSSCKAKAYAAGESCTVEVAFAPTTAGPRYGAASIFDAAGRIVATAFFQGTGVAPQAVIYPGTRTAPFTSATAGLASASAVAADGRGNIYIVDAAKNQVIKETLSGNYLPTVVANSRLGGLSNPQGTAVDGAGSVYIADTGNNRVVKATFTPASNDLSRGVFTFSTLHTPTLSAPPGVAVDGAGNVYIADTGNNRVLKLTLANGGYTESTIGSGFHRPSGLVVDGGGNVYIADTGNSQVWVEKLSGGAYSAALIGSGLDQPRGLAVDAAGNVYIADTGANRLVLENREGEQFTQTVVARELGSPTGVTVTGEGNLFIADSQNLRVVEVNVADPQSVHPDCPAATGSKGAVTLTLVNIGNAPLLFPTPSAGKNPFFALDNPSAESAYVLKADSPQDCQQLGAGSFEPASLEAGSTCLLRISQAPRTARGLINQAASHVLTLTDNSLNAGTAQQMVEVHPLGCGATAGTLTSPATSAGVGVSPLGTAPVTFTWSGGSGVSYFDLFVGTKGAGSYDLYNLQHTAALSSAPITFQPQGLKVYVRLASDIGGTWTSYDYIFRENSAAGAVLNAPTSGGLPSPPTTKTFSWTAGTGVTYYDLYVGTKGAGLTVRVAAVL